MGTWTFGSKIRVYREIRGTLQVSRKSVIIQSGHKQHSLISRCDKVYFGAA